MYRLQSLNDQENFGQLTQNNDRKLYVVIYLILFFSSMLFIVLPVIITVNETKNWVCDVDNSDNIKVCLSIYLKTLYFLDILFGGSAFTAITMDDIFL